MARKQTAPAPKRGPRPTGPTRKKGARARATTALLHRELALSLTSGENTAARMRAYWDPALHDTAPALRTSFGNFTTLNSLTRVRFSTSTTADRWFMLRWDANDIMALSWDCVLGSASSAVTKHMNTYLSSAFPIALRPLRMGVRVMNVTAQLNRGGLVYCASLDNGLVLDAQSVASAIAPVYWDLNSMTSLYGVVENGLDSMELSSDDTGKGVSIVSTPASYPVYNHYNDFTFATSPGGTNLTPVELNTCVYGLPTPTVFPYTPAAPADAPDGSIGAVPAMRTMLFLFKATTVPNDYLLELRRQDGVRYPVNSLGHSFSLTHEPCGADVETSMMRSIQHIAGVNGGGFTLSSVADRFSQIGGAISGAASAIAGARGIVSTAAAYAARARGALSLLSKGAALL